MEFKVEKEKNPNVDKYRSEDYDIALDFSKLVLKEFGSFTKAVVLFGSSAKEPKKHEGDIDILVIVDDITIVLSPQLIEAYRVAMETLIAKTSKRLHITTLRLTSFWEYMKVGDPIGLNILRDGVALIDTGIFEPMRVLLYQGRVRPSDEAVFNYLGRAPVALHNSRWHITQAVMDLYWAAIDAAHAAIMKAGKLPPSPSEVPEILYEEFVKKGILDKRYPGIMKNLYELSRGILHRRILDITGQQYETYYRETKDFIDAMKKVVGKANK